jgi:hypothetical protein
MPCDEISEVVTVVLDGNERLHYFLFEKITCGKIVPLSGRLNDFCRGMGLDAIDALDLDGVVRALGVADEETFFLVEKELDALQSAVANYRGAERGFDPERYKIESVEHGPDSVTIKQIVIAPKPEAAITSCRVLYKPDHPKA